MAYDRGTFDEFKTALAQVRSSAPGSRRHFSIPSFHKPLPAMTPASNFYGQIGLQRPQVQPFNAPPNNQFVRRPAHPLQHRHSESDIRPRQPSIKTYQTHTRSRVSGKRQSVSDAHKEILKLLINDPEKSRKHPHPKNVKRGTVEFAESMAHQEANIPHYWELYKENTTFSEILSIFKSAFGTDYKKIAIDARGSTYSTIVKMVNETFDSTKIGHGQDAKGLERLSYSKLWITKIQRIENPQLFRKYVHKRQEIFLNLSKMNLACCQTVRQLPSSSGEITTHNYLSQTMRKELFSEINEVYLFHGTKPDTIKTICNTGLDPRLGSGKAMFGSGIYGAEKASKADQYTDGSLTRTGGPGKEKKMFLMRVALGNCYLCTDLNPQKYRRPPCTKCKRDDCKTHDSNYDSVVGDNKKLFREFVVYDGVQCYPEYLITYERR
ncbi:TNKS-like protein [Mya arenaria]|uniref:Poly [ADP-ribose] polymerase n=1 Tax=Mya arenaria TaxID=6604 RepID=A0ABY7DL87_MYAAR|nr:TNKS-like protein [Mya arenaria]